ncbi:beta-ketoacyl synthase N-terminal-like domain-containing protein [Amycolatopsis sp. NPDC005003]
MNNTSIGVAIVGMHCRVPGADTVEDFWDNLVRGRESISTLQSDRPVSPNHVPRTGHLDHTDLFDARYFGYSPREAELLDPQQRLLLETATQALQRAGHDPTRFSGTIGIYAGVGFSSYLVNNVLSHQDLIADLPALQLLMSGSTDFAATRVAYKLDLRGPALTVQTACSTSLVAVHLAVQALLNGECDIALAGGASLTLSRGYDVTDGGILSPDGHCRPFDANAAGTVPGSGAGIVVLRRLTDAHHDNNHIHAIITGTATNNDGAAKVGYTAPSKGAQAAVIAEAQAVAGAPPDTVGYVEAHGAATPLGDPIEIAALADAFAPHTEPGTVALGSVKSNVGHLDAASGVVSLIKAALAVEHGIIPPTLHYQSPNPAAPLDATPFHVPTEALPWPSAGTPRRAGVSSFGIGGTNVHVIVEAPPRRPPADAPDENRPQVVTLAAHTPEALDTATADLAAHLAQRPDLPLRDVARTLHAGRPQLPWRRTVTAGTTAQAAKLLESRDPMRVFTGKAPATRFPLVFLISGVGDQYQGMARDLYRQEAVFRTEFDRCARGLAEPLDVDLSSTMAEEGIPETDLRRTSVAQPLAFAVNYALSQLYIHYGAVPSAVGGYSVGELVAACLAGVLPLDQALTLVARRAKLIEEMPAGAMLAVLSGPDELAGHLAAEPDLVIGAFDGPLLSVVSGPAEAVDRLTEKLTDDGVASRRLPTTHAFHSRMLSPVTEPLRAFLSTVDLRPPTMPILSNVTGGWLTEEEATDPEYFARHTSTPVRFADNLAELWRLADGPTILEIGPGTALGSLAMQHPARQDAPNGLVLPSLPGRTDASGDLETVRTTLGRLWLRGVPIDWAALPEATTANRVVLPTYPFQRERYWLDAATPGTATGTGMRPDPADWFYLPSWRRSLPHRDTGEAPWLVLTGDGDLGESTVAALRATGSQVVVATARPGRSFGTVAEQRHVYDPAAPETIAALLDVLDRTTAGVPSRIADLTCVTGSPLDAETALLGLLHLAQALGARDKASRTELVVVTSGAQQVAGEQSLVPAHGVVAGACRVVGQELPHVTARTIDLAPAELSRAQLGRRLADELRSGSHTATVALRGAHRWEQVFEPVRLADGEPAHVRPGGVYLLVGGLGRVGQAVARHLATVPGVKLAFVQRTELPPPQQWPVWQPGDDERIDRAIADLLALESRGAAVMAVTADLTSHERMATAIAAVESRFGPLTGVIHSAGMVTEGPSIPLPLVDRPTCRRHLASKVGGVAVLADLLEGKQLDFVLLNSSIASVLGGIGYLPYTAANCHLDAFAQAERERTGVPWTAINWEGWTFADPAEAARSAVTISEYLIDDDQAATVIGRILANDLPPQVVVSTGPLHHRIEQWVAGVPREDETSSIEPASRHTRPALQTEYVAPRDDTEHTLVEIWERLLGIDPIGVYDTFFSLGGHSLTATRVLTRITESFGVQVPMHELLTRPTVAEVAVLVRAAIDRTAHRTDSTAIPAVPRERYRAAVDERDER